jgi:hypothetical protein
MRFTTFVGLGRSERSIGLPSCWATSVQGNNISNGIFSASASRYAIGYIVTLNACGALPPRSIALRMARLHRNPTTHQHTVRRRYARQPAARYRRVGLGRINTALNCPSPRRLLDNFEASLKDFQPVAER